MKREDHANQVNAALLEENERLKKLINKMIIAMDDIGFAGVPASRLDSADTLIEEAKKLINNSKK